MTALTHEGMWDGSQLNITIKPVNGSDGSSGRIIITGILFYLVIFIALKLNVTDNGIGMTPDEMAKNLVRAFTDCAVDVCL